MFRWLREPPVNTEETKKSLKSNSRLSDDLEDLHSCPGSVSQGMPQMILLLWSHPPPPRDARADDGPTSAWREKRAQRAGSFRKLRTSTNSMMIRSSWRLVAIAVVVATCLVVAITIALLAGSDNEAKGSTTPASLGQALSVDADPLVVTEVRIVQAATDDAARNACNELAGSSASAASAEWIIAGRNLNTTTATVNQPSSNTAFTYLCMHQERTKSITSGNTTSNATSVLHSLRVIDGTNCPGTLKLVFSPRSNVAICAQSIDAEIAIETGMYVSDVTVTAESTYFSAVPGWITEGKNIATTGDSSSVNPVYLSYKRPVRPIIATRVVNGVATNQSSACDSRLGAGWEQAGYGAISTDSSNTNQTILCVQRARLNDIQLANPQLALPTMLVDIAFVDVQASCSDGFTDRQELTAKWALCLKFANSSSSVSYIGELRLKELRTNAATAAAQLNQRVSGANYRVQPIDTSNSDAPVIVIYRQHTGIEVLTSSMDSSSSRNASTSISTLNAAGTSKPAVRARVANSSSSLTFKVLQLADLHYTGNPSHECRNPPQEMIDAGQLCTEADTTRFVESVLDAETPDFVVFSGDNVEVPNGGSMAAAISSLVAPVEARKIKYAVVFGNHDDENGQSRESMASMLIGREYSYMQWGPTSIHGVGNYEVNVQAPSAGPWGSEGDNVFRIYLLDSLGYPRSADYPGIKSSYDWIKPDQVEYYKEMALANRANSSNASTAVPAIMFFHIPIPEYASVGTRSFRSGEKNEAIMSSEINSNLFSALVEMGDVKATFVGHDHVNEYCYERQGIQLCYGGGAGFAQAYGSSSFARRARLIEWSLGADNKRRITSWKRHHGTAFATRQTEEVLYTESR